MTQPNLPPRTTQWGLSPLVGDKLPPPVSAAARVILNHLLDRPEGTTFEQRAWVGTSADDDDPSVERPPDVILLGFHGPPEFLRKVLEAVEQAQKGGW